MLLMPLIYVVAAIVIAGVVVWGLMQLPMDETFRKVARIVIVVALVIFVIVVLLQMIQSVPGLR
jgi:hypothetical protein